MKDLLRRVRDAVKRGYHSRFAWIVIAALSFGAVAFFSFSDSYGLFEQKLYDIRFQIKRAPAEWNQLVLLNIDDVSLVNGGEFPWPRSHYAKGLDVLSRAGLRMALFDIQFMDESPRIADRSKIEILAKKAEKRAPITVNDVESSFTDNDRILSESVKRFGGAVIPYSFLADKAVESDTDFEREKKAAYRVFLNKASVPVPPGMESVFKKCVVKDRVSIQFPIPRLVEAAGSFGYVDSDFDSDGAERKVRLVRVFEGRVFFEMGLMAVMSLCNVPKENVEIVPGSAIVLKKAINPLTNTIGDIVIPVDESCRMYVNWAGDYASAFRKMPFYAFLEYDNVKDAVHEEMDKWEISSDPSMKRTALYSERLNLMRALESESNVVRRNEISQKIDKVTEDIRRNEQTFADSIDAERAKYLAAGDKGKADEYGNFATALRIVRETESLFGRIGIIGLTAVGTQDLGVIPLSSEYYMVGRYPNIINTIVQGSYIRKVPGWINVSLFLVLSLSISALIYRLNAKSSLLLIGGAFFGVNAVVILLFAFGRVWAEQLGMNLSFMLPSLFIVGMKFLSEESQKRFIKSAFSHYLSKQVIEQIIKNPEALKLGGEEREITIFFSDIKGFTSISEKLTPAKLVHLLNEYLSEMTDTILSYNGTVDKFIGDAVMAFYGAPQFNRDHARDACFAAIDMQKLLKELRGHWRKQGYEGIYARFGINTGRAVIGNMGSRTRMDYTAMGDSVNLASRLEGANKYYGTYSMISEMTYEKVKHDVETRFLDRIRVVGKEQPIQVFELIARTGGLSSSQKDLVGAYNRGIELFSEREWEKARAHFRAALKVHKDDGPSATYIDRCTEFMKKPPSKNWDGVYKLAAK
jgi:adenylate cyclase